MKYQGKTKEFLEWLEIDQSNAAQITNQHEELSLIWFAEDHNELIIDAKPYTFSKNQVVHLTEFHRVEVKQLNKAYLLRWNRSFFCILDHDNEIGCRGALYYGSSEVPNIQLEGKELEILKAVFKMIEYEFVTVDHLQREMLQMMLKRILILCTRIYNKQSQKAQIDKNKSDLIRDFNFLVEQHFREKHSVSDYAELLFKSPKTLSNLFKKQMHKSPLQYIQERIMLEARRLLFYSDKSISNIADELGFQDIHSFSRFFKTKENCSPQQYRNREKLTNP